VRLDAPLDRFVRQVAHVVTSMWIMAYGDVQAEVKELCEQLKVPVERIG
jgi:hypothetical protein